MEWDWRVPLSSEELLGVGWRTFFISFLQLQSACFCTQKSSRNACGLASGIPGRCSPVTRGGSQIWVPGGHCSHTPNSGRTQSRTLPPPGSAQQADGSLEGRTDGSRCSVKTAHQSSDSTWPGKIHSIRTWHLQTSAKILPFQADFHLPDDKYL